MNDKLLFAIVCIVIFMGIPAIFISSFFRQDKNEKKEIIEIKINYVETFWNFFLYSLLAGATWWGGVFLFLKSWSAFLIISPLLFLSSIDWVILFSHFFNSFKRKIFWDKKNRLLIVKKWNYNFEIKLAEPETFITKYYPPIQGGGGKGFPGFSFEVLKISDDRNSVKISSLEFSDYNLDEILKSQHNYKVVKRQFNIIFW